MQNKRTLSFLGAIFTLLLFLGASSDAFAQGRGRGGGNAGGNGGGPPAGAGQGGGVNQGLGTASVRSGGRSDTGLATANERSMGRSAAGLDRARHAERIASRTTDNELNRFRGLSRRLDMTPEQLRAQYQAALLGNPDLKFGHFVAANVIADNLSLRYPNVTTQAILAGLANGNSLGSTLRILGVGGDEADSARKDAEARIKAAKRQNK